MHLRLARKKLDAIPRKRPLGDDEFAESELPIQSNSSRPAVEQFFWSNHVAYTAALTMLWLTILALLVLITSPLVVWFSVG
jgi:hypothetical protein